MSVSVVSPADGDTVSSPVTVTYVYEIYNDATFFTSVGPYQDSGKNITLVPPGPNSGTADSDPITVNVDVDTEFIITVYGGDQGSDSAVSVTVRANGSQQSVDGMSISPSAGPMDTATGSKKKYQTDGDAAPGSAATYVVCQVINLTIPIKN